MTITAAGLTACHGNNGTTPVQPTTNQSSDTASVQPTTTYNMNIPATISGDGTFADDKYVYVYDSTTGEVFSDGTWFFNALFLTDISADGKKCTIKGPLVGTISPGDSLVLLYDINRLSPDPEYCGFYYGNQYGTANIYHGAMAVATADSNASEGMLTTTAPAVFQPQQSWLQFKFADKNGKPISVASLIITADNPIFTEDYKPFVPDNKDKCTDEIRITPTSPTNDYLFADIRFHESCSNADVLTFTVTDAEGNDYKGTKPVPKGGFKNGKCYVEPSAIRLTKQAPRVKPTIDWISVSKETEPDLTFHKYELQGPWMGVPEGCDHDVTGPAVIAISGKSKGYWFHNNSGATITLNNLTATFDGNNAFIQSNDELYIIVNGTNRIVCKNSSQCIAAKVSLRISGNGTLSVTANDATYKGLFGRNNYNDSNNSTTDRLADYDTGETVVLKSKTHNGDGTWTFTYEVTNASH
jgi:hypothetical protein